jgi:hypothetical protein
VGIWDSAARLTLQCARPGNPTKVGLLGRPAPGFVHKPGYGAHRIVMVVRRFLQPVLKDEAG